MDLELRTRANHLVWIRRMLRDPGCTASEMIRLMSGENDIHLVIGIKSPIRLLLSPTSPFYAAVLRTWETVHGFPPENEDDVRAETLWDNKRISSPKHMLQRARWRQWIDAGIMRINDICHPTENRIMGHQEIAETFNVGCSFLDALLVRQSIPFRWRSMLSQGFRGALQKTKSWLSTPKGWTYSTWDPDSVTRNGPGHSGVPSIEQTAG